MGEAGGPEEECWRMGPKEEFVKVRRKDLERLTTEVMQIRDFLPRILDGEVLESFRKLQMVEKNLERKEQELEQLRMDCEHFKSRLETVQADGVRERKDKALKFFSITGQTMESFVKSLDGDVKELDSDENQFVFALAGIVTNVAAIACGREFLVTSSRVLLDTILQLLGDLKPGQCTRLKVLMLMSLYNVSINLKGLKYISESPGFIPLLWWLLGVDRHVPHGQGGTFWKHCPDDGRPRGVLRCRPPAAHPPLPPAQWRVNVGAYVASTAVAHRSAVDPDAEVCLHVLRLVQSVVLEPEVFSKTASELRSSLPLQRILAMSRSRNPHLQTAAQELLEDLRALERDV
ncbi:heat shock factor 2-binding protein isoform X2 [Oryctolagus cuniculus]|uniref:heat shock factor 2-binding protein isoform X2 n=2 Tax=Oryctolagus cuniculus TaxID=9986 RepID=UPI0007EE3ADB